MGACAEIRDFSFMKAAISLSGKTVPEVKILMQKKLLDNQGMNIDNQQVFCFIFD